MIIVVYCCICFLLAAYHCQDITDSEGFFNDSPFALEPRRETMRVKVGTPLTLKCRHKGTWEYKECEITYKGLICDTEDVSIVDNSGAWKRLHPRIKIDISSSNRSHSGLYRCIEKGVVTKFVMVEVVGSSDYELPPPSVASLKMSNITNQLNMMDFTIQCNVNSTVPPKIIWFKNCYGQKCDIKQDDLCYCPINRSTSAHNIGNVYISKINIFNAREVDNGLYACLAMTEYGKDYKNVTVRVPSKNFTRENISFSLLFLVPLALIVAPVLVWWCYLRRKKKSTEVVSDLVIEQQRTLMENRKSGRSHRQSRAHV